MWKITPLFSFPSYTEKRGRHSQNIQKMHENLSCITQSMPALSPSCWREKNFLNLVIWYESLLVFPCKEKKTSDDFFPFWKKNRVNCKSDIVTQQKIKLNLSSSMASFQSHMKASKREKAVCSAVVHLRRKKKNSASVKICQTATPGGIFMHPKWKKSETPNWCRQQSHKHN